MNYPLEKYHYYTYRRADGAMVVKAVSTYAGQNIFGKAVCHPNDKFDLEKGKELAAARCNEKVAERDFVEHRRSGMRLLIFTIEQCVSMVLWQHMKMMLSKRRLKLERKSKNFWVISN